MTTTRDLALHDGRLYWPNVWGGTVMTMAKDGGDTTVLSDGEDANVWNLAVDAARRRDYDAEPVALNPATGPRPWDVAVHARWIFWTSQTAGTVNRVSR